MKNGGIMKKFYTPSYKDDFGQDFERGSSVSESRFFVVLPKILLAVACLIVVSIIFITAAAFATKKATIASGLRRADPSPSENETSKYASYTDLGQMRLQTADENSVLILEPWFPYKQGDVAFLEEINEKSRSIKILITSYFRTKTKAELLSEGENAIKKELLDEINNLLVMGKFSAIYFSEYLFLN